MGTKKYSNFNWSGGGQATQNGASGSAQSGNPLATWEQIQVARQEAVEYATDVIALSPEGVVTGAKISTVSLKRNPLTGSVFLAGLIAAPIVAGGFLIFLIRGMMFPAPIAQTAPMQHRVGNAAGRLLNGAWTVSKPGVAALEVQLRQNEASRYGASPAAQVASPNQALSTNTPGLITVSNQQTALPKTGLSQAEQAAIQNFLK